LSGAPISASAWFYSSDKSELDAFERRAICGSILGGIPDIFWLMPPSLNLLGLLLVGMAVGLNGGCASRSAAGLQRFEFQQPHMGTRFTITLYAPDAAAAEEGAALAFDRIAALDRMMTDFDPESELVQLCRQPAGMPVRVSEDLFDLLVKAQRISELSGGAFDVTIGPLVRQWRRARRTEVLPDAGALARAKASVGWRKLKLDEQRQTVALTVPNMQLDLGGIAKGYAADAALKVLRERELPRALVAASGDLAIGDAPPGERGWRVGIGVIGSRESQMDRALVLKNAAVSTSGDAEQSVVIGGRRYSHIVDPQTGLGLTNSIQVTVIGGCATDTDAYATTACVLGVQRGLALIEAQSGLAAILICNAGDQTQILSNR
jgi:FAD:protein FMN transferase